MRGVTREAAKNQLLDLNERAKGLRCALLSFWFCFQHTNLERL
jgi:hypothetical protein